VIASTRFASVVVTAVILWLCVCPLGGFGGDGTARAGDWADIGVAAGPVVIINELHVNPDIKTELVEFVELHNPGTAEVDLAGWQFTQGIFYTFPAGAVLPAGGFVIVAQNPDRIRAKWGMGRFPLSSGLVFGPYGG